jgi:hypothetical protein
MNVYSVVLPGASRHPSDSAQTVALALKKYHLALSAVKQLFLLAI